MPGELGGYAGAVLHIDLTSHEVKHYPWSDDDRRLYLGGKIMAARIITDIVKSHVLPFSCENPLVVTTGPLTGTGAPSSSRFNVSTVSPLTNILASSNCGGSFGLHLKRAGWDGLVITGQSASPVWIEIRDDSVEFHDASDLWGTTTGEVQEKLPADCGKMVIGPAGENLVLYASILSGDRAAGRAGVGAVMGWKKLKALAVRGSHSVPVHDREKAKAIFSRWVKLLRSHPLTGSQLPRLGTAGLIVPMHYRGMLATSNFRRGRFDSFEEISGEAIREKHLVKNKGCITCPIQCGRVVKVDGKEVKGPELETLGLLGSNIGNADLDAILRWNYLLDELGMDTISAGGTIAFAMELNEKGLWHNGLEFGCPDCLDDVFRSIAYREGIGDLLAEGSMRLAQRFGGEEFAMHSKGLELSAYEPRRAVGMGLGYATSNRGGCHLNGGYAVLLEGLGMSLDPLTVRAKAGLTVIFQDIMEAISAAGNCLFTAYPAIPPFVLRKPNHWMTRFLNRAIVTSGPLVNLFAGLPGWAMPFHLPGMPHSLALSAVVGEEFTFGRLKQIGERGYNLERLFNQARGVSARSDTLPRRLTDVPQDPARKNTRVPLEWLKRDYYRIRGWSGNGEPGRRRLRRLGIEKDDRR